MGNSQSMFLGHIYLYNEAIDYSLLKVPFISKSAKKLIDSQLYLRSSNNLRLTWGF